MEYFFCDTFKVCLAKKACIERQILAYRKGKGRRRTCRSCDQGRAISAELSRGAWVKNDD